jgi:hypothetical protein
LKKYSEGSEETIEYTRDIIKKIRKRFYIDNCVTSVENEKELRLFIKEASLVFAEAKFNLRGWDYLDPSLENPTNTVVLGLTWDRKVDTLAMSNLELMGVEVVMRRTVLSLAQWVFDPIGFTCPISLKPKLLLQKCWEVKGDWEQEVPEDVKNGYEIFLFWKKSGFLVG